MVAGAGTGNGRPRYFYKFRSLEGTGRERTRSIITDNQLWFSKALDFNDPFDCRPSIAVPEINSPARKAFEALLLERLGPMSRQQLRAMVRQARSPAFLRQIANARSTTLEEMGVLCLSARRDPMLMWSHYAASHTGICLRFRAEAGPFAVADKVHYPEQRPAIDVIVDLNDPDTLIRKGIFTKASCWRYEAEWRLVGHPGSSVAPGPGPVAFDPKALDGIILGARISDADAAEVTRWIAGRKRPVELLQARANSDHYRLDFARVTPTRAHAALTKAGG